MREAFLFEGAPGYLLRDRDRIFGGEFCRDVEAMGIREVYQLHGRPGSVRTWNG